MPLLSGAAGWVHPGAGWWSRPFSRSDRWPSPDRRRDDSTAPAPVRRCRISAEKQKGAGDEVRTRDILLGRKLILSVMSLHLVSESNWKCVQSDTDLPATRSYQSQTSGTELALTSTLWLRWYPANGT